MGCIVDQYLIFALNLFSLFGKAKLIYNHSNKMSKQKSESGSKSRMSKEQQELIDMICERFKEQDYLHRGFLKPIEIALKNFKTSPDDTSLKPGNLSRGLRIAVKDSINNNKYTLCDVAPIPRRDSNQQPENKQDDKKKQAQLLAELKLLQENNQDNLLTLCKSEQGIQLAICICMYSEDKRMLKSTLAGVGENIINMVKNGIISDCDKIGVFVLMDGIEKVHESVVDYFQELEHHNNINLGENIAPQISMNYLKERQKLNPDELKEMEMKNLNNYLFTPAELQDRNQRRFKSVKEEYELIKNLLKQIQKLKNGKLLFDDLPNKLKPFFFQEAREQRKRDYGIGQQLDAQNNKVIISEEILLEEYAQDIRKVKPLVAKALQEGERHCKEYMTSREDLAYLGSFRNILRYSSQTNRQDNHSANQYEQVVEEDTQFDSATYMNLFLCVKYKNAGKLTSHDFFFNGFCRELNPKYAVLLDVGLKPNGDALMKMYNYMHKNKKVGGTCGYMSLKIEQVDEQEEVKDDDVDFLTNIMLKFADIQRTQQVEYHFAHLMDKPFQASFGFIHVLPGAFSAYNMKAIFKSAVAGQQTEDDGLLKSYFKSIDDKLKQNKIVSSELSVTSVLIRVLLPEMISKCFITVDPDSDEQMLYNQNINLAEDRILCMGIHVKGYDMAFLPDAYAEVDPIKTVHGLLGQRKRWINGSFFAFEKVKKQLGQYEQQKSKYECLLHVQMFYLTLMNALSYFAPAFFLFTVHIAMQAFRADVLTKVLNGVVTDPNTSQLYNAFVYTMDFIYVMLILSIIFLSLHLSSNNQKYKPLIYAVSTLFGLFSICVFIVLVVDIIRGLVDNQAFLIQNKALVGDIPGGIETINAMRWILVASTLIYAVPIMTYVILFKKFNILGEIIVGAFSFLFYSPTYLNILNIYSLCRIDDISWGTKGLDTGSSKNDKLKDSWKLIKFVHVGKYVLWNIVFGITLLSLGASYKPRFFITIIMVAIMGVSMSVKIIVGLFYMIHYKMDNCCAAQRPKTNGISTIRDQTKYYKTAIQSQIKSNLSNAEADAGNQGGPLLSRIYSKKNMQKSYAQKDVDNKNRSGILKKVQKKYKKTQLLAEIKEERHQDTSPKPKKRAEEPKMQPLSPFNTSTEELIPKNKQIPEPSKKQNESNANKQKKSFRKAGLIPP